MANLNAVAWRRIGRVFGGVLVCTAIISIGHWHRVGSLDAHDVETMGALSVASIVVAYAVERVRLVRRRKAG
ncbi:hypothetical protein [Massilia sp. S19_KUP03_FR1]|uniref:hypothetical protein n=1 Tax=Massilia sp. S19_KUP03_FR1 TaxID=3025503 RepID=UPI002FCD0F78